MQAELIHLLQLAYSAEKAAAFAYQGHAGSIKCLKQKEAIRQIEIDEWDHRKAVLTIMQQYNVSKSKWLEIKFGIIGKLVAFSCYVTGFFIPTYFAARLESGNTCEYFRMMDLFDELNIKEHHAILNEMGNKEKEHEIYLGELIADHWLLPIFQKIFKWGPNRSYKCDTSNQIKEN